MKKILTWNICLKKCIKTAIKNMISIKKIMILKLEI